jgi:phage tail-like protein
MPSSAENLPEILTSCRFYVELQLKDSPEPIDAYFLECKGFKQTQDVVEFCEVAPQKWGKEGTKIGRVVRTKVPGNLKINNIVLRRGLTCSSSFWDWFKAVRDGNWAQKRKDGSLTIYDQGKGKEARFDFRGAWPISYTLTDVSASSNEIEIEEMEIALEEFWRKT